MRELRTPFEFQLWPLVVPSDPESTQIPTLAWGGKNLLAGLSWMLLWEVLLQVHWAGPVPMLLGTWGAPEGDPC